eukprot:CAMPEP_0197651374 /NCGR_PEP_ID=MMETSP1338-20131121/32240_1 /TAXON_ID=43686 ORGANISM="Pelagodinium beii, Strain RCC1491" /NCGR_SAMPLE_ID=MMETSP1338 /ASSEMBLY_ACC=CAM_ASM_000754 /LENGTH=363 /DNA_ID=CAMNT_0043225993 /DNA_START=48 /DNA_END=1139 /DNA_ORIENTATION=-
MLKGACLLGEAGLNVGQIGEFVQGHRQQKEQIQWARRAYRLECQSVRLDVFDHVKEEIRSHHATYMGNIDTLLLVMAIIWPFALNTIQFSDPFVPETGRQCQDCIEHDYKFLMMTWVLLIGVILILPFWGILMLIRCKLKLDKWLEYSLARLNHARRENNGTKPATLPSRDKDLEEGLQEHPEELTNNLVNVMGECQEYLAALWKDECGWLVHISTSLLWVSSTAALMLTALSMWLYLVNKGGRTTHAAHLFASIVATGLVAPIVYVLCQRSRQSFPEPPSGHGEPFTLASSISSAAPSSQERMKRAASLRNLSDDMRGLSDDSLASSLGSLVSEAGPSSRFWCPMRKKNRGMASAAPLLGGA